MKSIEISFGHAASHSPWLVHEPNQRSISSTMMVRSHRSGWPCGSRLRCSIFAAVNSCAALLGQAATQAPHPMHTAASIAESATSFGMRMRLPSGALPVGRGDVAARLDDAVERRAVDDEVADIGNDRARHGSTVMFAPSSNLRMCSWHVAVPRSGPCGRPLIIIEHEPQMPSRQSWSKATGSRPCSISRSLSTSKSSRNDMSG